MTDETTPLFSYTQTDAAKAVGLSRSTIRRRRENGHFPNAFKTKDGEWMIPEIDLLSDGLELALSVSRDAMPTDTKIIMSDSPTPPGTPTVPTAPAQPDPELLERLHRAELAAAEARAQAGIERARAEGLETALEEARAGRAEAQQRASDNFRSLQIMELFKNAEASNRELEERPRFHLDPEEFPGLTQAEVDEIEAFARQKGRELRDKAMEPKAPKAGFWKRIWTGE